MTYAWRSPLDASRPRFLEIRGRFCLSSHLIDWDRFLERSTRSIDPGFTSTLLSRNAFPQHRGRPTGADPAHFGYCSRRKYGLLFLQPAMRALMGRTIITAVGAIANWAIYSSPSLPRITESCGGMLRMFTGGIPAVARAAAVQLSHSFAIPPSRN